MTEEVHHFTYAQVAWMQKVQDRDGVAYLTLGVVLGMTRTIAVTPYSGDGRTLFFCQDHNIAYPFKGGCEACRTAERHG